MLKNYDGLPMLSFALTKSNEPSTQERCWTKSNVLIALNYIRPEEFDTIQLLAGIQIMINTQKVRDIVYKWKFICENFHYLIDDSQSTIPNLPGFRDHRHDQSIISILRKQHKALILPDETTFDNEWDSNKQYPFHARRFKTK